jgi:L-threonylcarbamoyladenylate synthase
MEIAQAIKQLRNGYVVAIPTETVYGLAADATNTDAIAKIFQLKQRPSDNPLIVHVGDKAAIEKYAYIDNPIVQMIIDKLMPWPITILLTKKNTIPNIVTAGSDLVAIRIPQHPIALAILNSSWLALAAPSANISGKPSPTNAIMVQQNFGDSVDIIDGWDCNIWIESTVVQVEWNRVLIHRPWFITPEDIGSAVWSDISVLYSNKQTNISPGVKYKHYAPKAQIHLLDLGLSLPISSPKTWLIVTDEWLMKHRCDMEQCTYRIYHWGSHDNLLECAQQLYQLYHKADKDGIRDLYIEQLPEENGIGYAIMNRVKKSLSW